MSDVNYIRSQGDAVISALGTDGEPRAAYASITATDAGELVFDAKLNSRKVANLHRDPRIAIVVRGVDGTTLQLQGLADFPTGADLDRCSAAFVTAFPQFADSLLRDDIVVIRVVVDWSRFGDFR